MPQIEAPTLRDVTSATLVLLGGVAGAFFIWWLDGRRIAARERRELAGALELVALELAGNIAQADFWVRPGKSFGPIELRWDAWAAHQTTLARHVGRDLLGQIGVGYELARALMHNVGVARGRGHVIEEDAKLARRARDWQAANLRQVQKYMRGELKIRFTLDPADPVGPDPSSERE